MESPISHEEDAPIIDHIPNCRSLPRHPIHIMVLSMAMGLLNSWMVYKRTSYETINGGTPKLAGL